MNWTLVVRSVYLLCLALAVLVAFTSYMSGASFEALIQRTILTLAVFGLLGWGGILVLLPDASSKEEASGEEGRSDNDDGASQTGGDGGVLSASA